MSYGGKKADANQAEIIKAYRALGCTVISLHAVGKGVPDLLVGICGETHLVEVKRDKGKLSERQIEWQKEWRGDPVCVVHDVNDVVLHVTDVRCEVIPGSHSLNCPYCKKENNNE